MIVQIQNTLCITAVDVADTKLSIAHIGKQAKELVGNMK